MSDSDNRKSQVLDNWEDEWENDDEIEAKLKANIEETKKKEIQNLVDKAEEDLIEDLFLHDPLLENPLLKKVEQKGGLRGLCPRVEPNLQRGPFILFCSPRGFPRDPVSPFCSTQPLEKVGPNPLWGAYGGLPP